jgi:[protein-PII] uridylyltransferase
VSADLPAFPAVPPRVCSAELRSSLPPFPTEGTLAQRLASHRRAATERIRSFHAAGGAGLSTARLVTAAADLTVDALWAALAREHGLKRSALLALGGSGRREMSPGSDWDLLLLHDGKGDLQGFARTFTTLLWDVRVHLGWSVRTLAESEEAARTDLAFRTALLDARHVAGDASLWHRAERGLIEEQRTRGVEGYLEAKVDELRSRRERFGDTVFLLEPNPKQGQGGLRDLETALWLAQVRFRARTLGALLEAALLPPGDVAQARAARDFLLRIRHAAHLATERREDRLTFELQASLAQDFGYAAGPEGAPVERFMRHVYVAAATLRRVSDAILARTEEERGPRRAPAPGPERRFGHFKTFHGRLTTENSVLFQEDPAEVVRCSSSPPSTVCRSTAGRGNGWWRRSPASPSPAERPRWWRRSRRSSPHRRPGARC